MAVNVNYQEAKTGSSALHYAVKAGDLKLVNLLVQNYADVRAQDAQKQNAMHLVCISGKTEIFKTLIQASYSAIEGVDVHEKTPLDYARAKNHKEIIDYLRKTSNMLYSIEQLTIANNLEEENKGRGAAMRSRPVSGRV